MNLCEKSELWSKNSFFIKFQKSVKKMIFSVFSLSKSFHELRRKTKWILDKKWGVLKIGYVKMIIWLKSNWNAPFFWNLDSKSEIFVCKDSFKALNAPKYRCDSQIKLPTVKYDVSAFTGKRIINFQ